MNTPKLVLALLDEAYERKTWHGPNLKQSLKGVSGQVLNGWQLSGATTFRSGKLFTPVNQRAPFVGDRSSTHPDRLANA